MDKILTIKWIPETQLYLNSNVLVSATNTMKDNVYYKLIITCPQQLLIDNISVLAHSVFTTLATFPGFCRHLTVESPQKRTKHYQQYSVAVNKPFPFLVFPHWCQQLLLFSLLFLRNVNVTRRLVSTNEVHDTAALGYFVHTSYKEKKSWRLSERFGYQSNWTLIWWLRVSSNIVH